MTKAIVFAMRASFVLTYTLISAMAKYMLKVQYATWPEGGIFTHFQACAGIMIVSQSTREERMGRTPWVQSDG